MKSVKKPLARRRDLVEIFGYHPADLTHEARTLWRMGACPFTRSQCTKINHDQSIIYGTCSVTSTFGDIVICPNRLYADNYRVIKDVARDAFPSVNDVLMFSEYVDRRASVGECIVALGKGSGREVQVKSSMSMDWVLAHVKNEKLVAYVGIEVQSIDITGNYRDSWHFYKNMTKESEQDKRPSSEHGLNWANVHKRLIPQLIRKGVVYSRSSLVPRGLYFVLPDIVYKKFEDILGDDIPHVPEDKIDHDTLTVHTYSLGQNVPHGNIRDLELTRNIRISVDEFSKRFINGPNLPSGKEIDAAVRNVLGINDF